MSPRLPARLLATQSDQRLLELIAKGHERAFEALVLRYRRPLLSYCRRLGLSEQRAEDVLQQALLKAWMALLAGAPVREARPWLYRIVHNTALNAIRGDREDRRAALEDTHPDPAGAELQFERRLAAREALAEVAALPPMQRDAILLTALDGRSHDEVASALGISNGAVRGLIYRARAALRGAAAALVPPQLLSWAAGGASGTAERVAQLSGSGGGQLAGALLKVGAVAVTAALAAGAALGPLHRITARAAHGGAQAARGALTAAGPASGSPGVGGAGASAPRLKLTAGRSGSGPARTRPRGGAPLAANSTHGAPVTRIGAGSTGTQSAPTPASTPSDASRSASIPNAGSGASQAGGSASGQAPPGSGSGASGTPAAAQPSSGSEPPPVAKTEGGQPEGAKPVGGETSKDDGSGGAREAESHKAEAEAAEARERAEREAAEARERSEREAQAAPEHEPGKDN